MMAAGEKRPRKMNCQSVKADHRTWEGRFGVDLEHLMLIRNNSINIVMQIGIHVHLYMEDWCALSRSHVEESVRNCRCMQVRKLYISGSNY